MSSKGTRFLLINKFLRKFYNLVMIKEREKGKREKRKITQQHKKVT